MGQREDKDTMQANKRAETAKAKDWRVVITAKVTAQERAAMVQAAKDAGQSLSAFVRGSVLGTLAQG